MRLPSVSRAAPLPTLLVAVLLAPTCSLAADSDKSGNKPATTTTTTACTTQSTSGAFFDLRPDIAVREGAEHSHGNPHKDYKVPGFDYGTDFYLNICEPVVEKVEGVIGVKEESWKNISAYYVSKGYTYSLGTQSGDLVARGKELVLQYTGGSPCTGSKKKSMMNNKPRGLGDSLSEGDDSEHAEHASDKSGLDLRDASAVASTKDDDEAPPRRKSATIFFSCNRDINTATAGVSFIATDPDECSYVFKVRSRHACAGAEPNKPGSVGPGFIFFIIIVIAILVYLLGGIFYNRTVSHARGWKQLPNYTLWATIWSFICDVFVIATSSCARFLPNRRGYHYISGSPSGMTRSSRDREAENRLIDQLDEEWDD